MDHRSIGSLRVSVVGLGCNNFGMRIDAAATDRVVNAALDAGIKRGVDDAVRDRKSTRLNSSH